MTARMITQHHPKRNNTLHRHILAPPSNEGFSLLSKEKRYPKKKTSRLDVLCKEKYLHKHQALLVSENPPANTKSRRRHPTDANLGVAEENQGVAATM